MDSDELDIDQLPELIAREIEAFLIDVPVVGQRYKVIDRIGEGTFSTVYKAYPHDDPTKLVALKRVYLISSPARIENEARFLVRTGGQHNVVRMIEGIRYNDQIVLVLDYFEHTNFKELLATITPDEIRCYMRALFESLAFVHREGVIHRDVKPTNFLFNRSTKRGSLVDFGLAQDGPAESKPPATKRIPRPLFVQPAPTSSTATSSSSILNNNNGESGGYKRGREDEQQRPKAVAALLVGSQTPKKAKTVFTTTASIVKGKQGIKIGDSLSGGGGGVGRRIASHGKVRIPVTDTRQKMKASRAGTRGFRAPEILFKDPDQSGAVDIWSAGVVLLIMLSGRYPFFLATDDLSALYEIRIIFGFEMMRNAGLQLGRHLVESEQTAAIAPSPPLLPNGQVDWRALCERLNPSASNYPDEAYDLLSRCLCLLPSERITAKDAYLHPFLRPQLMSASTPLSSPMISVSMASSSSSSSSSQSSKSGASVVSSVVAATSSRSL